MEVLTKPKNTTGTDTGIMVCDMVVSKEEATRLASLGGYKEATPSPASTVTSPARPTKTPIMSSPVIEKGEADKFDFLNHKIPPIIRGRLAILKKKADKKPKSKNVIKITLAKSQHKCACDIVYATLKKCSGVDINKLASALDDIISAYEKIATAISLTDAQRLEDPVYVAEKPSLNFGTSLDD